MSGALLAIGALGYSVVHKAVPYFEEISESRFNSWKVAPYVPAGSGKDWDFRQCSEGAGAMNHDATHFVLRRDGKIYDLINANDTWGFGGAASWEIDLQGSQLYIFDAHQHVSPGWFHLTTGTRGWLVDRLGFGPEGSFDRISSSSTASLPRIATPGSLFTPQNGQLKYVGTFKGSDDLLEQVESGDYYLTSPGIGVVRVFDLAKSPASK
jgi:hypothetical protein